MTVKKDTKIDRVLDIKGEICPYTFVKSKLALEEMEDGEVLKVIVDYPPATENVPRSLEKEGNEIIAVKKTGEKEWEVIVRKRSEG
ncbi:MAG: sulfurtransferase TusA family protein [Thermodesulfovibrionia bacterium]|jgi:TusA-related sulfurtransferase|nr:sulfurtransferase TusA family protein [Thermodesulfovibrionia bacterium]